MAAPNPANELARIDKLAKGGLPPIVLVTGVSDFFRSRAVERLLRGVPEDAELRHIDGNDTRARSGDDDGDEAAGGGAPELLDLRGGGLFARSAVVVVRRAAEWWKQHAAAVVELWPKIAPGSSLIVETPKPDRRKKAVAAMVKQLAQDGAVFEFRDLHDTPYDKSRSPLEGELCQWVVKSSRALGVPLQPDSAWLVISQVGKQPADLLAELERLRTRFADGVAKPLAPEDLRGALTVSFESTPFEFAAAVLAGDRRAAQRSLSAMFDRGVRQQDGKTMDRGGVLPFTTSWLFGQLANVYEGRILLDSGVSPRDVAAQVGVRQFADRFVAHVRNNDQERLRRGICALHACQRKSRLLAEDPQVLLEHFLAQWFDGVPIETAEELGL